MTFSSTIPHGAAPALLPQYLSRRFTYQSEEMWLNHIAAGRILVNGRHATSSQIVKAGDSIAFQPPAFTEPPADCNFRIVYEDAWIIGIDKPGNLLVHRSGKSVTRNLIHLLREGTKGRAFPYAGLVHRLDRGTSGVVIVAASIAARAPLQQAFASGKIDKKYIAIVKGTPPKPVMTIDAPIGRDLQSGIRNRFCVDLRDGKPSVTRIEVVEELGQGYTMIRAWPLTGRTHQIRVHLAWIGTPCVGDALYGMAPAQYQQWAADPSRPASPLEFPRQALHCACVSFIHPFKGNQCIIVAPLSNDMQAFVESLKSRNAVK